MNIEDKIQNLFTDENSSIDADKFMDNLHKTRERKLQNKQRLSYGISSLIVILLVGILSITQLSNNSLYMQLEQYYLTEEMSDEMIEEYYNDLMIYLADQSDDIWSTMELYYEVNNENFDTEE